MPKYLILSFVGTVMSVLHGCCAGLGPERYMPAQQDSREFC